MLTPKKGLAHVTISTGTGSHNFSEVLIAAKKSWAFDRHALVTATQQTYC